MLCMMDSWLPDLIWDSHVCLPLDVRAPLSLLDSHVRGGTGFVSVNVGMDMNQISQIMRVLAAFRAKIAESPDRWSLVRTVADIDVARSKGALAIAFDLEGSLMLQDMPEMLEVFSALGVRQIHFAYNRNNSVSGGCHDDDMPLTALGRRMVRAVHDNGMIMDCSHMGRRSSLDVMEVAQRPVVFSHTNPRALCGHERCIDDDLIRACAQTGGVVGLSGLNRFFGIQTDVQDEDMIRHIDHVVAVAGINHVGIGLDVMHELPGMTDFPDGVDRGYWWPVARGYTLGYPVKVYAPENLSRLARSLLAHGYNRDDVSKIMGGNFRRVASATWGSASV
ncbi:peptidase M19 [Haematospirillum sp. 15-248]|nr:peptidase M19 [Haematospirillum sp. H4890]NKD75893.1 peptidase M19 [Haematospirillum sp. H4485]NKD87929.1 peptidase M19 [Haematospirillum sp. 15-248]